MYYRMRLQLCAAHMGMATSGCAYNWRSNHWVRLQLGVAIQGDAKLGVAATGAATIGCCYNWVRLNWVRLQLGAATTRWGYILVWLQLGAATIGCGTGAPTSGAATTGCIFE
jgi:hypothetical protein